MTGNLLFIRMRGSRGGVGDRESDPRPEKSQQYIGFLSKTGPEPLKINLRYQVSIQRF